MTMLQAAPENGARAGVWAHKGEIDEVRTYEEGWSLK